MLTDRCAPVDNLKVPMLSKQFASGVDRKHMLTPLIAAFKDDVRCGERIPDVISSDSTIVVFPPTQWSGRRCQAVGQLVVQILRRPDLYMWKLYSEPQTCIKDFHPDLYSRKSDISRLALDG